MKRELIPQGSMSERNLVRLFYAIFITCILGIVALIFLFVMAAIKTEPRASDVRVDPGFTLVCNLADMQADVATTMTKKSSPAMQEAGWNTITVLYGIRKICHEIDGVKIPSLVEFVSPAKP